MEEVEGLSPSSSTKPLMVIISISNFNRVRLARVRAVFYWVWYLNLHIDRDRVPDLTPVERLESC